MTQNGQPVRRQTSVRLYHYYYYDVFSTIPDAGREELRRSPSTGEASRESPLTENTIWSASSNDLQTRWMSPTSNR